MISNDFISVWKNTLLRWYNDIFYRLTWKVNYEQKIFSSFRWLRKINSHIDSSTRSIVFSSCIKFFTSTIIHTSKTSWFSSTVSYSKTQKQRECQIKCSPSPIIFLKNSDFFVIHFEILHTLGICIYCSKENLDYEFIYRFFSFAFIWFRYYSFMNQKLTYLWV